MDSIKKIGSSMAEIVKVATNLDGSCRLTLDLPEISAELSAKLLAMKMHNASYVNIDIGIREE